MWRRVSPLWCVLVLLSTGAFAAEGQLAPVPGVMALQQLRNVASTGRVLHIGAHPDDENTQLIAYLSRGRGYDTAYLSVTRGDGGQNLLGPEFDEKLGVARTQELMAARRIDGGRQFFTRAVDFGFSKTPEETLAIWNHQEVLGDVVRVIRLFRPDVIVTRFPIPPGSGGHGHHTASAILAVEAFKLAGDPKAYPEQLTEGLRPWQAKRIVWNVFGRVSAFEANPTVKVDIGGNDPVTGEPFGVIAARSRAMHKTQGFGDFGSRANSGPRPETFVLLAGEPMENDFMDGIDTGWSRVPSGDSVGSLVQAAVSSFKADDPAASVPALLAIREKLAALPPDTLVSDKRAELNAALRLCLGIVVSSRASDSTVVPGQAIDVEARIQTAAPVPVRWVGVEYAAGWLPVGRDLAARTADSAKVSYRVPPQAPITQPYWLRRQGSMGMYHVDDPALIGLPVNPPDLPLRYVLSVGGQSLVIADELIDGSSGASAEGAGAPVAIVPPVSLRFESGATLIRPGATRDVTVNVIANRSRASGTVRLLVPTGWQVSEAQKFSLERPSDRRPLTFQVTAPAGTDSAMLGAEARIGAATWTSDLSELRYAHIPRQLLQPAARKRVVSVTVETRGHSVGYLPGAGDDIPEALTELGYQVTMLKTSDLVPDRLRRFDAVVIGVRAFNTLPDLAPALPALSSYVQNGGTVVCQYNWARNLKAEPALPYPLKLSDSRVTNEAAPVTFLAPDHPVLNVPNRIGASDFEGWIQERGVYFPSEWDGHFVPILAMSDPGEAPLRGALLVASHGRGHVVYTGLAFFRQLPAGVPGAYRLFANLVSLPPTP